MLAASADSSEAVRLLHNHGATLELQDALGRTALMFAAGNGRPSSLQALLDLGASLATRDRKGRGPLTYCDEAKCPEAHACLQARCGCVGVMVVEATINKAHNIGACRQSQHDKPT